MIAPSFRLGRGSFLNPRGVFAVAIMAGVLYGVVRFLYYYVVHDHRLGLHFGGVGFGMAYLLLIAPVWEEYVFRGILLEWLSRRVRGRVRFRGVSSGARLNGNASSGGVHLTYANLLTASVFAGMHLLSQSPANAATVVVPAIIFGMVYERYRSVVLCIIVHISYNIHVYIY